MAEAELNAEYGRPNATAIACAQGRFNRAAKAWEAAKVAHSIASREYREAKDALIKLKAEAKLGRRIDGSVSA